MIALKQHVCPLGKSRAIFAKTQRLHATVYITTEGYLFGGQQRVDFQCYFSMQNCSPPITKDHPVSWPRLRNSRDHKTSGWDR